MARWFEYQGNPFQILSVSDCVRQLCGDPDVPEVDRNPITSLLILRRFGKIGLTNIAEQEEKLGKYVISSIDSIGR